VVPKIGLVVVIGWLQDVTSNQQCESTEGQILLAYLYRL